MKRVVYYGKTLNIEEKYLKASEFLDPGMSDEFFLDIQLCREIAAEDDSEYEKKIESMTPEEIVNTYVSGLKKELALRGRKI